MIETTSVRRNPIPVLDRSLGSVLALDWEKAAWIVLLLLAILSRFYALDTRVISHDESLHTYYSWQLYRGQGFQHTPLMHGPFQFHVVALAHFLFGASDASSRLPAAVFGVVAVGLLVYFRKWLGRSGALVAGLLMVISPYMLYYSRYVRNEAFVVLWALLLVLAVFRYIETRKVGWLYLVACVMALHHATKEVAFIYEAIWMLFLGLVFVRDVLQTKWDRPRARVAFQMLFFVGLVAAVVAVAFYGLPDEWTVRFGTGETRALADPTASLETEETALQERSQGSLVAGGIAAGCLLVAALIALLALRERVRGFASLDLLVILGSLVLPQLVAFPVKVLLHSDPLDYSEVGMWKTGPVLAGLLVASAVIGLAWNWRKWLIAAGIFYGIYIFLFTTMFTNGAGLATGMVGSLGYWLEQQGVHRGSQPWYYYFVVQTPMYEYLPAIGTLMAAWFGLRRVGAAAAGAAVAEFRSRTAERESQEGPQSSTSKPQPLPVLPCLGYWVVMAVAAYSVAGEKMPWLTVHLALPMILVAGWAIGRILDRTDWQALQERGGVVAAVLILVLFSALGRLLWQLSGTNLAFQGTELVQLEATMLFMSALVVLVGVAIGVYGLGRRLGGANVANLVALVGFGVLVVLTVRTTITANYVNFDNQTEFINYASGAPGIRAVMEQVEDISRRTTDGLGVQVAYDDDVSWPFTWYLRDYTNQVYYAGQPSRETFRDVSLVIAGDANWARVEPLLGNNFYSFEYIRMWWPMQDYFHLTTGRIYNALGDPRYRKALWNIWFWRDYTGYGELTGVDYSLSSWPVVDRMRFYVRKDLGAQLWNLGVGPVVLSEPPDPDPYEVVWRKAAAQLLWGIEGTAPGQLQRPRDVAVGPDGFVYVADTFNHRVQKFDGNGNLIAQWGGFGAVEDGDSAVGRLSEPWGLAVSPDGFVYVADTWNHRVQKFGSSGQFVATWGRFGNEPDLNSMWGPREVAIGPEGNVYVADTGNKRISVFDRKGTPIRQIGSAGALDGELDEPIGVAVAPSGDVYVADTWNRRVQVFSSDGSYLRQWHVSGWFGQSLDNKAYLALDESERVYVSDPEGYRIFVSDRLGTPLLAWGDYGSDNESFGLPTGLAIDGQGSLYVADSDNHRIMRFDIVGLAAGEQQ